MSWRTVLITKQCHLSYKNNYMVVRGDDVKMIHLSEIYMIIIENMMCTITVFLMNELRKAKIKVVFCDEKHNPAQELVPYYGSFDTSKVISKQIDWDDEQRGKIWQRIIKKKIEQQALLMKKNNVENWTQVMAYVDEVEVDDKTNREGFAAKVYFNSIFEAFTRNDESNEINSFLNYGYSILLSMVNREVVKAGYMTQIGIHHKGATNPFNLSCDLMEPFRPIVDQYAVDNVGIIFEGKEKLLLIEYMNSKFRFQGKEQYLPNIISSYVSGVLESVSIGKINEEVFDFGKE